jgi:hypothetical protein
MLWKTKVGRQERLIHLLTRRLWHGGLNGSGRDNCIRIDSSLQRCSRLDGKGVRLDGKGVRLDGKGVRLDGKGVRRGGQDVESRGRPAHWGRGSWKQRSGMRLRI